MPVTSLGKRLRGSKEPIDLLRHEIVPELIDRRSKTG